jgi:hypothetical protein
VFNNGVRGTSAGLETHARLHFNPLPFTLVLLVLTDESLPWRNSAFRLRVESSKIGLTPFRNFFWHNTEFEGLGPRRGGTVSWVFVWFYLIARVVCISLGLPPRPLLSRLGHYFGNKAGSRRVFWFEPYCIGASYHCYIDVFFLLK